MKVLSSASARPNFVKLAAVHHAFSAYPDLSHVIVHTGQHYDPLFSDIFFEQLNIALPTHNLGVKGGGTREEVIQATADAFAPVLEAEKPDVVLVYGDVNGAVGAARAAKKAGIRIGHIEAGLRSFDTDMPEELNRIEIDRLSDDLFVSEQSGLTNLRHEGIQGKAHFVGNTMIDTLIRMQPTITESALPFDPPEQYCIATLHRPSNVDSEETLRNVLGFLAMVTRKCPVVFPLHLRTKATIEKFGLEDMLRNMRVIEPLGYTQFLKLLSGSSFILTDSGGIQEEAAFLQKRCFTLRRNTERPSTVKSGSNVLLNPDKEADRHLVLDFAASPSAMNIVVPEKWDGKAGSRILGILHASS